MKNGDRSAASRIRRYYSVGILAVAMLLSITSVTHAASSFYWYGENNSTCWQTGQPGSPSKTCSTVGAGYLPTPGGHTGGLAYMSEGGAGTDLTTLSSSGDYCSYYRVGDQLTLQDSTNEGSITGISMPTPYSSYQEGDKTSNAWNACQADGSYWGQAVRGPSGGGCSETCGMHHYVSFRTQGTNDRPWSAAFGAPSFMLSAEAGVHTFSHTGTNYRGWGYVCPELEDTSSHGVLEYCLQEWRSANDPPEWKNERKGECSSPYSQVNTFFWPGTSYATEMPGSTNTFEVGSAGSGHFEAKITEANLKNAAKLINAECAGWHLSESPGNYALVGVEQGLEGEAGVMALGGWAANLQLRTEYTAPSPPPRGLALAAQGPANALDFYESSINGPWKKETIGGEGSTYGIPSVVRFEDRFGRGIQLAVQGPNHTLDFYSKYDGASWTKAVIGGEGTTYGTPSMVRFSDAYGTGNQIAFEGPNHTLNFYTAYDGEYWIRSVIGGEGTTYGTPSMVRFDDRFGTGNQIAFQGPNHTLNFYAAYDNQTWSRAVIGGEGTTYGQPSMVRFNDKYGTGNQIAFEGPNHTLNFYTAYDGEYWIRAVIGSEGTTYGVPSMVRFNDRFGTGNQIAFDGPNHTLNFYTAYDGEYWIRAVIGSEGTTYGPPSMTRFSDEYGTGNHIVFEGPTHTLNLY